MEVAFFSHLFLPTQRFSFAPGNGELLVLAALLHVTTSPGELARRNSWATLALIRSAMPIAKFPNTSPAPRLDLG